MALGYNALNLLRLVTASGTEAAALAVHWHLDHLLRKLWENSGLSGSEAWRGAEIAIALLKRSDSKAAYPKSTLTYKAAKTPGALASMLILENYDSDDFRKILGVNRFDDVTWFSKEAFEETLFLVPFFLALDCPGAFPAGKPESQKDRRIKTIADVAETFRMAGEKSQYRFDELSGALVES
jgi:hypothetical protein